MAKIERLGFSVEQRPVICPPYYSVLNDEKRVRDAPDSSKNKRSRLDLTTDEELSDGELGNELSDGELGKEPSDGELGKEPGKLEEALLLYSTSDGEKRGKDSSDRGKRGKNFSETKHSDLDLIGEIDDFSDEELSGGRNALDFSVEEESFSAEEESYGAEEESFMAKVESSYPSSDLRCSTLLTFGKYEGLSYQRIFNLDKSYCRWALNVKNPRLALRDFNQWLRSKDC